MKTLAILAQKGGSGKTTLAVHMAVCATRRKLRTALIDLDPQGSAYDWNASREDSRKLDAVKASSGQLAGYCNRPKPPRQTLLSSTLPPIPIAPPLSWHNWPIYLDSMQARPF